MNSKQVPHLGFPKASKRSTVVSQYSSRSYLALTRPSLAPLIRRSKKVEVDEKLVLETIKAIIRFG